MKRSTNPWATPYEILRPPQAQLGSVGCFQQVSFLIRCTTRPNKLKGFPAPWHAPAKEWQTATQRHDELEISLVRQKKGQARGYGMRQHHLRQELNALAAYDRDEAGSATLA